jgi:hypothetical protein
LVTLADAEGNEVDLATWDSRQRELAGIIDGLTEHVETTGR